MATRTRKALLRGPDAPTAVAQRLSHWMAPRRRLIWGLVAASLTVVGGIWGVCVYRDKEAQRAAVVLSEAWQVLDEGIVDDAAAAPDKKSPPAPGPHFKSERDKWLAAQAPLDAWIAAHKASELPAVAKLLLADLCQRLGDEARSVRLYKELAQALKPADPLFFIAAERLAYALEATGAWQAALDALEPLARDDKLFYADYAQFHQARLHRAAGQPGRWRQMLGHLEGSHPNSSLSEEVLALLHDPDMNQPLDDTPPAATAPVPAGAK